MKKKTAVVLALLLTLVVVGTFVSIVTGWFNPVVKDHGPAAGLPDIRRSGGHLWSDSRRL